MKIFYTWSEAIRAGTALRPVQAFRKFFDKETGGTCANGAALEAIFGEPIDGNRAIELWDVITAVMRDYYKPSLNHYVPLPCKCLELLDGPEGQETTGTIHRLDNIIVHLNNHHRWTREAIADWLESEEEKLGFVTVVKESDRVSIVR